jgi:hypothetical protein
MRVSVTRYNVSKAPFVPASLEIVDIYDPFRLKHYLFWVEYPFELDFI